MRNVRDEFKLNRQDVDRHQIRNALKARNASGNFTPVDFSTFESAYKALADKVRPWFIRWSFCANISAIKKPSDNSLGFFKIWSGKKGST